MTVDLAHVKDIKDRMVQIGRNHFEYRICGACASFGPDHCEGYQDGYDLLGCLAGLIRDRRLTVDDLEGWLEEYEKGA